MDVSDSDGEFDVERWVFSEEKDGIQCVQQIRGGQCRGHCDASVKERRMPDKDFESDRNSPPLYEVELTASDEDDDTSVLELVIPMQTSRYQRVPTSSPKKGKHVAPVLFCNLLCCMRKK